MNDWDDRALDAALQELNGSKPPDLSARVLNALHEAERGPLPRLAPRPPAPVSVWALAAVLLLATGLGFVVATACYVLGRSEPSSVRESAALQLDVEVLHGTLTGSELRAASQGSITAGERGEFVACAGNRLRSDGACAFRLGSFGTLSAPALMELEVQSMEITTKQGVIAASSLTLAVVAGVVTWHTLSRTESAAAGEVLRMHASTDDSAVAALTAENRTYRERIAELELQNASLRAQNLEREAVPVAAPVVAKEPEEPAAKEPAGMTFTDPRFADALAKVDWEAMGAVTHEMGPVLAELMAALKDDGSELPVELVGKVQELNGKLVAQVPAMLEAKLPGFGENGFYTHPLVAANILASTLEAAGTALTPAQKHSIDGLVASFARENQAIADAPHEFRVEHLLAECEMKDRFYSEVGGVLAPNQHGAIFLDGANKYDGGSLFSSGLVEQVYAQPVPARDAADFARNASRKIADELDLDDATAAQVRTLLEQHSAAPELWRDRGDVTEKTLQKMRAGRTRTALRHQIQWMRVLQSQVALTPAQKKKLAATPWVLVPLPK